MTHATPSSARGGEGDQRRVPVVAGQSREDLDRVAGALGAAGLDFEVEEGPADPERGGGWSWRVLIRPTDLGRVRPVLEALVEAPRARHRTEPSAEPLFDAGSQSWLRNVLVLLCLGLAALLVLWA